MKVTSFTFSDNSLIVYFDVDFRQINYIKMESQSNDSQGTLECEEMEIKYSKKKNTLNLFISDTATKVVLLITIFDNKDVCYSYYMTRPNSGNKNDTLKPSSDNTLQSNNNGMDIMARGFTQLFKNNVEKDTTTFTENFNIKVCPIKNQNIFANIKKKD